MNFGIAPRIANRRNRLHASAHVRKIRHDPPGHDHRLELRPLPAFAKQLGPETAELRQPAVNYGRCDVALRFADAAAGLADGHEGIGDHLLVAYLHRLESRFNFRTRLGCTAEARALRRLDGNFKFARVVPGKVSEFGHGDQKVEGGDTRGGREHDDPSMMQAPTKNVHVMTSQPSQQHAAMSFFLPRFLVAGVPQKPRRQHGRERE